jgi:uncharacterized membrane protein YheB (UPF0754 family)
VAEHLLREFALNVVLHSLAGGLTDTVAVWMLFNPHNPVLGIQGAIPKNKARLARSIGKVVGEKLLTPEDLTRSLTEGGVRGAFEAKVAEVVRDVLHTERGSLRSLLPESVAPEVTRAVESLAQTLAAQAHAWAESEAAAPALQTVVARVRRELGDRTVADVLPPARRAALHEQGRTWVEGLAQSVTVQQSLQEGVEAQLTRMLASDAPLLETLPASLVPVMDRAVDAYLPQMVDRLGAFLAKPESRSRVKDTLQGVVAKFVDDLRFHERVLARFLVTERAMERALDALGSDGVDQLASLLRESTIRTQVAHAVRDGAEAVLRRPLRDLLGQPDAERVRAMASSTANAAVRLLQAEATQDFVATRLDALLDGWSHKRLDEVLAEVSDETLTQWLLGAARSDGAETLLREAAARAAQTALDAPIGRPDRWLGADAATRISAVLGPAVWDAVVRALPSLMQQVDVPGLIERKVNEFSTQQVEQIVRGVTQRELNLIIKFGFLLGALIGVGTFFISQAIRQLP